MTSRIWWVGGELRTWSELCGWGSASRPRGICPTSPFRYRSELCMHWPCRQNCARNHETPTPVTDSVACPPPHISEERRSGQQSYGYNPSEITRSSISSRYTQLHCSIESGTTCLSRPCNAPAPPRAGRTARRFGAPLTPRLARRPLCGEPLLPPTFRRRVAGVPPVRRGALRWTDSVSADFQFQ
jgi:hypothetical protein